MTRKILRRGAVAVALMVITAIVAVVVLTLVPLTSDRARHPHVEVLTFDAARSAGAAEVQADTGDTAVVSACRSKLLVHPGRTTKSVLMLHGFTSCPKDFDDLAEEFYRRGYNVFVPREQHHGLGDLRATAEVTVDGLLDYADRGLNIAAGLGQEVGVVGISGGAVLATWLTEYRTESVTRLLALSPFYEPGPSQAPGFAVKPIVVLFGHHLVPDFVNDRGFSFAALSQYLRIVRNFQDRPRNEQLRSVAVVRSAEDPLVDLRRAFEIPTEIARINQEQTIRKELPTSSGLEHEIVGSGPLGVRSGSFDDFYFEIYEGGDADVPQ